MERYGPAGASARKPTVYSVVVPVHILTLMWPVTRTLGLGLFVWAHFLLFY